jgi:hypothetical protein
MNVHSVGTSGPNDAREDIVVRHLIASVLLQFELEHDHYSYMEDQKRCTKSVKLVSFTL